MAKQSSPSASSPARRSPEPRTGAAVDLPGASVGGTGAEKKNPSASSPARRSPRPHQPAHLSGTASPSSPPAGFIFMCSGATKPECFQYRVLGLPRWRLDEVSRIKRGAWLFLYDFDAKYLYGPYHADSDGGLALEPHAFSGRYPAQVKFTIGGDFMPIPESSVRSAIAENYSRGKFRSELTFTQVEKLSALFRPITSLPEPISPHFTDVPTAPSAYLSASASYPTQPAAYVHHPIAYVPAPAAHRMPYEPYARSYSHVASPIAQFTTPAYYVRTNGYQYQAGYEAYRPSFATYQYGQEPPSRYLYAQYPIPEPVPAPIYSTDPYYAAQRNDSYQLDTVKPHYQESTSERTAYGGAHDVVTPNLQLVVHYGSIPSSETAAPEATVMNLALVRSYGSTPNSAEEGAASAVYSYAGTPGATQTGNAAVPSVYLAAAPVRYQ